MYYFNVAKNTKQLEFLHLKEKKRYQSNRTCFENHHAPSLRPAPLISGVIPEDAVT
jgi:hypothetical protein